MTTEVTTLQPQLPAFTPEQVQLIKTTVARGASDDELKLFLHVAQKSGLDPFSRQIYAIKRWDSREKKEVMQAQTSIDGYRLVAERTGRYVPGPKPQFSYKPDGSLLSATAFIKKLAGQEWHLVEAEAFWDEYAVYYEKDGKRTLGTMWNKMPHVMLAKCAESLVIRRAFPNETTGIYTVEEMSNADKDIPSQLHSSKAIKMPEAVEPAGDLPVADESKSTSPETPESAGGRVGVLLSKKQQGLLFWIAKQKGWTDGDLKAWCLKMFGKDNPLAMNSGELNRTLDQLKTIPDVSKG